MKKKIYIAGCGGMLGKAFFEVFKEDYELKCTDIDLNEDWLTFCDFRDFENYQKDVLEFAPDYLFHLGAHTSLEYCEENEKDAFDTNHESVKNACEITNKLNVPLLYISTAGIFDGKQEVYIDSDLPVPLSVYGLTKYKGELEVQKSVKDHLICRAGWMMGGGVNKDKKFINKIMKQLKEGKKELFVVNDKAGTPTYTVDFAKNTKLLIERGQRGLFNMVCEGLTSRIEVTQEILNLVGLDKEVSITEVDSNYFKESYGAPRPDSERLINERLNQKSLNIMRDWRICLKEYLHKDFANFLSQTMSLQN